MTRSHLLLNETRFILITFLIFIISLSSISVANQGLNSVLLSFNSEIGITHVVASSFTLSNLFIHLNEEGFFNQSSMLYKLYNDTNFAFNSVKPQGHPLTLMRKIKAITNNYLIPIILAYEKSIGSNYTNFVIVNSSVIKDDGGYQISVYYEINYSDFVTVQASHLLIWINATTAKINIVDPISLTPIKGELILPNLQIIKSIIQKIDSNGINWSDIRVQPVLYREGNALIPLYKVSAFYPESNGNALFLTAYVLPNMTILSQQISENSYFGLQMAIKPTGRILFYYNLFLASTLISGILIGINWKSKTRLKKYITRFFSISISVIILSLIFTSSNLHLLKTSAYTIPPTYSSNWAGYIAYVNTTKYIGALFPVECFNGGYWPIDKMGQWIGFGGVTTSSLIQAGVGYFNPADPVMYFNNYAVWYETLPSGPAFITSVSPGNQVCILISNQGYENGENINNNWYIYAWVFSNGTLQSSNCIYVSNYKTNGTADFIVEGTGLTNSSGYIAFPIDYSTFNSINLNYAAYCTTTIPVQQSIESVDGFVYKPTSINATGNFTVIPVETP